MASTYMHNERPFFKRGFRLRTLADYCLRFLPTRPLPKMPAQEPDMVGCWQLAKARAYAERKYREHLHETSQLETDINKLLGVRFDTPMGGIGLQVFAIKRFMEDFEHLARQYQDILLAVLELEKDNLRMRKRLLEIEKAAGGFVEAKE